jgi:hypothetical protein
MTLILAVGNPREVVLVSDRRFSTNTGFYDDEKNKATTLHCLDGRAAIAFTGLAEVPGRFSTTEWLMRVLPETSKPDCLLEGTIRRFCNIATRDIAKLNAPDELKRLTFAFAGYKYDEPPPRQYFWKVTNSEAKDGKQLPKVTTEFECFSHRESRSPPLNPWACFALTAGLDLGIRDKEWNRLVALLHERRPAVALVEKAVMIIRMAADSPLSFGAVGKQCSSIVLPSDPKRAVSAAYHSNVVSYQSYGPNQVICRGEGGIWSVMEPVFEQKDATGASVPMAVPKARRNQPCPCGSGKKYKKCHGGPGGPEFSFGPPN